MKKAKAQRRAKLALWRPLKAWKPSEWIPFAMAWGRVEKMVSPRYELQQAFRSGQLIAAVQLIAEDGAETWFVLERECWRWLLIQHARSISGWRLLPGWWKAEGGPEDRQRGRRHLFVRRSELDKHYPAATAATPIEHRADDSQPPQPTDSPADDQPTRRKPGPKPRKDWPKHVNREIVRALRAGKPIPAAADLAQSCEDNLGYQPDISAVQKHVGHLLNRLLG